MVVTVEITQVSVDDFIIPVKDIKNVFFDGSNIYLYYTETGLPKPIIYTIPYVKVSTFNDSEIIPSIISIASVIRDYVNNYSFLLPVQKKLEDSDPQIFTYSEKKKLSLVYEEAHPKHSDDQVGDGTTITGKGTILDPFVSIGGGPGGEGDILLATVYNKDATTGILICSQYDPLAP